ncbi:MAG: hypothetical protein KBS59_00985 [Clostridiales bacterium]|nr:hypothetical protein [Clostridiales bacterium]
MKEYICTHCLEILAVVCAVATAIILCYSGYKNQAKSIVLYLVAAAEQKWGSGTGDIKYAEVVSALYDKLPNFARIMLSEKTVSALIEGAVKQLKDILKK